MKPVFLLWNIYGALEPLAMRLTEEGYTVYCHYADDDDGEVMKTPGKNVITCCEDPWKIVHQYLDNPKKLIIIADDNGKGHMFDVLYQMGFPVIGVGCFNDKAEHDREEGNRIASTIGLNLPKRTKFTDFSAAVTFLESQDPSIEYVVKFDGAELAGGNYTYIAKDTNDMKTYLNWAQKHFLKKGTKADSFTLQEIVDGVEVDYEVWFNGEKFVGPLGVTFEEKKQHDLGAAEGCLGQVYFLVDTKESRYFSEYLSKLEPILRKNAVHPGFWAINNIISHDGKPYYLEFTPRHGWDATVGLWSLIIDSGHTLGDFYERLAYRKDIPRGYFQMDRVSCAVRLYSMGIGRPQKDVIGRPVFIRENNSESFWLYSVEKEDAEDSEYAITGNELGIGVATAVAGTIDEAVAKVYDLIDPENKHIITPDLVYSESIGERATSDARKLRNMGWL